MNFLDRPLHPPTPQELRDSILNAAVVLRDVSFLPGSSGLVRLGCRATMRGHALRWRMQFVSTGASHAPG